MRVPSVIKWRRPESPADEGTLWLIWLVRLRWVAIVAQVGTLALVSDLLASPVLLLVLLGVDALLVVANLHATRISRRERPVGQAMLLGQLMLDVLALTAFFFLAGGPDNPFTTLYLIHVAMGAVMLRPPVAALFTAMVLAAYGALHLGAVPLHLERHPLGVQTLTAASSVVAFTIASLTIAYFVLGLANTLRWREKLLLAAQERTARTDRLRSVGTMAAGAAHELNTPLSTMGLRLRRIARRHTDPDTVADLRSVRDQLDRCTRIVEQLLVGAGDPTASQLERDGLAALVADGVALWAHGNGVEVDVSDRSGGLEVEVPRVAFVQGLVNLLENAREAQEEVGCTDPIEVIVTADGGWGEVVVRDHGVGLPADFDRVGEPFFTTKASGTGLGVFVARSVADGSGGGLRYVGGNGWTEARWRFPRAQPRPPKSTGPGSPAGRTG